MKVRCIFAGVGQRGRAIFNLFAADERFTAVALVDVSPETCRAASREEGWAQLPCFGTLGEAAAQVGADAAIISTPTRFHDLYLTEALRAGLHAYVSAPFTPNLDGAVELVALAEERELALVVDQQRKYGVTERTLTGWTRERRYGELAFVSCQVHEHRPAMGSLTGTYPHAWEQGCHDINSLLAICGRPVERVHAVQVRPAFSAYNGPTVTMAILDFRGGLPCQYLGSFDSRAGTSELRFEYERAAVRAVGNGAAKRLELAKPGGMFEAVGISDQDDPDPPERFGRDSFYRAVTQGGRVADDGRENLMTLAVIDAFVRSAESGGPVAVRRIRA